MAQKQIGESYHFSISLGHSLFSDLLSAALPFRITGGPFNLVNNLRDAARQLQVKEKVAGLLEGPQNEALTQLKERAASAWGDNRERVYELLDELIKVEGDWELSLDREGSEFTYAEQQIGAEAYFKVVATGRAVLLRNNIELPFKLEKRVGAQAHLGDIRFDKDGRRVVGTLRDLGIDLGDNILLRMANDLIIKLADKQIAQFNPVPILQKSQLDDLVGGAGTALKLKMEVSDVALEVNPEFLTLKVRFGFSQLQLAG